MKQIARNPYYEINVDTQKNRAYLKVSGFWRNVAMVADYVAHWEEALRHLKRNFTIQVDARKMQPYPHEVQMMHEKAQLMTIRAGVAQVAEILPRTMVLELQADTMCKHTRIPRKKFVFVEEAERWLDTISKDLPRPLEMA